MTFELPVSEPGRYRVGAIVTRGPEYGRFRASVNGQPAVIGFRQTEVMGGGRRLKVITRNEPVYDAHRGPAATLRKGALPVLRTVDRIDLGEFALAGGVASVVLEAVEPAAGAGAIGVDQWVLRRVGE